MTRCITRLPCLISFMPLLLAACTAEIGGLEPEPGAPPEMLSTTSVHHHPAGTVVEVCNFNGHLPFRQAPDPSAGIIRYLPNGTRGVVKDKRYTWHKLDVKGTVGWAYGTALCRISGDAPTTPPKPPHPPPPGPGSSDLTQKLPYFYQYANAIYPGSSCQNTSLAMVLALFGWQGTPDQITQYFGKYKAQSPGGLAQVFNHYAAKLGISRRLTAHTNGTLGDVLALLKQGKPVIVHGYFTSSGHVIVLTGFDGSHYTANDPAGRWNQVFKGGYGGSYEATAGRRARYTAPALEKAILSTNGYNSVPVWYHELR